MAPFCYIIENYRPRRSRWYATQANPMNTNGENDFYPILTTSAIFRLIWQVAPPFEQLCIRVSWATLLCNINEFCSAVSGEDFYMIFSKKNTKSPIKLKKSKSGAILLHNRKLQAKTVALVCHTSKSDECLRRKWLLTNFDKIGHFSPNLTGGATVWTTLH